MSEVEKENPKKVDTENIKEIIENREKELEIRLAKIRKTEKKNALRFKKAGTDLAVLRTRVETIKIGDTPRVFDIVDMRRPLGQGPKIFGVYPLRLLSNLLEMWRDRRFFNNSYGSLKVVLKKEIVEAAVKENKPLLTTVQRVALVTEKLNKFKSQFAGLEHRHIVSDLTNARVTKSVDDLEQLVEKLSRII